MKTFLIPLFIAYILSVFLFTCKNGNDKKIFKPRLTTENYKECMDVLCYVNSSGDTVCYKGYNKTPLPKNHICCKNLIEEKPSTPPDKDSPPDTLPESQMISMIIPDSSKIYGFDDGRSYYPYDKFNTENRIHYISVKEGEMIQFQLYISSNILKNFNYFKVKTNNTFIIAFDSLYIMDTLIVTDTLTDIRIYGRWQNEILPAEITIDGINRRGDTVALVCDTCEQQLHVFCWREMVFDSLRIYFVNNPPFNPDSITLKNEINKIIKQAVQKVAFVSKGIYNETGWDNNGNGILDFFPNSDSVPPERLEHFVLLDSIQTTFSDCYSCKDPQINRQTPKIIITPAEINSNWLLIENACVGSDTLIIQYAQDLLTRNFEREVEFTLSDWDGSNAETFQLNRILYDLVDADEKRMGLEIYGKTLNYDHPRHSVLKWNNSPIGITFTTTSCTWMMGASTYHDIAHEFLHMRKVGPLSHDKFDTLNLMNKNHLNPLYNLLRYRQIETDNCMGNGIKEQQWKIIRSTKY